jgi:hypothetical protein
MNEFFPISFDVYAGNRKISSYSVKDDQEKESVLKALERIYRNVQARNEVRMEDRHRKVPCVIVVKYNLVHEHILCRDKTNATAVFTNECREHDPDWLHHSTKEIADIINVGCVEFHKGSVCLSWAVSPDIEK